MPRRLLDQDRQRERRRQMLLLDRISLQSERLLSSEIARTTVQIVKAWEASGKADLPPEHNRRINLRLRQMWSASIQALGGRILEQAKSRSTPVTTKASHEDLFERMVQEYILTYGGEQIAEDISRTTVTQIMAQIEAGREAGVGVSEIAKSIRSRAPSIGRARAAVIARTETHSAGNFGALKSADEVGLPMMKEWISDNSSRTRSAHRAADGQTVPKDEPFTVDGESLMYPGDQSGSADNVINCRCSTGYIVMD